MIVWATILPDGPTVRATPTAPVTPAARGLGIGFVAGDLSRQERGIARACDWRRIGVADGRALPGRRPRGRIASAGRVRGRAWRPFRLGGFRPLRDRLGLRGDDGPRQ